MRQASTNTLLSLIFLVGNSLRSSVLAQESGTLSIPYTTSTCDAGLIFDTSSLSCASCPTGYFATDDQLSCQQCDTTSGFYHTTEEGFGIDMTWAGSPSATTCSCPSSVPASTATIQATVLSNGVILKRCVTCPAGYSAGTSSSGQSSCIPPAASPASETSTTPEEDWNLARGRGLSLGSYTAAVTATFPRSAAGVPPAVSSSYPLATYLGPATLACLTPPSDRAACNAVANMCALQLYASGTASTSQACAAYSQLVTRLANASDIGNGTAAARPPTDPLPWLVYQGTSYDSDADLGLSFVMRGGGKDPSKPISVITLVLSTYALNGTWLGYRNWTKQFQICGTNKAEADNWNKFGWDYANQCQISLTDILLEVTDGTDQTLFYDIFILNGANSLYPIPVVISPNLQATSTNGGAVRRFFYVDNNLGRVRNADGSVGPVQVIQYPTSISLVFTLQTQPRNEIFPPVLYITYAARSVSSSPVILEAASFQVSYVNNNDLDSKFWYAWQITMIVIECIIAFPIFVWKMFLLMRKRRAAPEQTDQDLLVQGLIYVIDIGSAGLTLVLLFVSVYYLVLYKLQQSVYFMMLSDGALANFQITVILAVVGQTVGMLNLIYEQTKTDIVFLDWEKPRKVLAKDGGKEETSPVSCWRMLLLGNELNELQTRRLTSPGFTLLMMCMILVGNSVIASGDITPYGTDYTKYKNNVSSILLRFGTEAAFFFVLFIGQVLFYRIIYFRFISNPINNLVDLAFLANISIFIFDERHSGYYIHGRNQAPHSDAGLRDLNMELLKEEEGLVGNRGLVTSYTGDSADRLNENQIFNIFIPSEIRDTFETKMLRQTAQAVEAAKMRKGNISSFLKGTGKMPDSNITTQQDIGTTFKQMIDDVERHHAKQVIDPTYFQMLTMLPPEAANKEAIFLHDYFNSFTSTMYIGQELRLYGFEAIFFCAIDTSLQNVTNSALITFIVSCFLTWVRTRMGENNLSQKTLIDQHFLM